MFNTYIYGTPLGFDFYEDVASLKEYFKGLYISSRRGRRLMVNRRDNGETVYSYLRYGLAEKEGRPNSFFGMSISMDGNEYAYDFKEIFDWFDYLFNKMVDRGVLFSVNAGNVIQYKIGKFKEGSEEVQWLKNNIPNLFTKAEGTKLLEYDSSFSTNSSGQIRCFNDETSNAKVLEAFKQSRWIALSPNFKPEEEPIEINPIDIEAQLNLYTQQLVPIAISPKFDNLSTLNAIINGCTEIIELIQKYLKIENSEDEQNICLRLIDKAKEIISNARTIVNKIKINETSVDTKPDSNQKKNLRVCKRCGKSLPISQYSNVDSRYCRTCESEISQVQIEARTCVKCGKIKPVSDFIGNDKICSECHKRKSLSDYINAKYIAIAVILILIVGISIYLVSGNGKTSGYAKGKADSTLVESEDMVSESADGIDVSSFNTYISEEKFQKAYEIIKGKENVQQYKEILCNSVENYLWNLIDNPATQGGVTEVKTFFITNKEIVEALNIKEDEWIQYAEAYNQLMYLIEKPSFSKEQRDKANKLIANLPEKPASIRESFQGIINNKPDDGELISEKQSIAAKDEVKKANAEQQNVYVEIIDSKGSTKVSTSRTFDYIGGEKVTVKANVKLKLSGTGSDGVQPRDGRKTMEIDIKEGKNVIVSAGSITITINGKKADFKKI